MQIKSISITRDCAYCGKAFTTRQYPSQHYSPQYCSKACQYPGRAAQWQHRFWRDVRKDGPLVKADLGACWAWVGRVGGNGYGRTCINGKWIPAHRVSYELAYGSIPSGLLVCHKCDNPLCVRPEHFFLGTVADNVQDMWKKGRAKIQGVPRKLNEQKVRDMRRLRRDFGVSTHTLAEQFGVTDGMVRLVISGKAWKHLLEVAP